MLHPLNFKHVLLQKHQADLYQFLNIKTNMPFMHSLYVIEIKRIEYFYSFIWEKQP